MLLRCFNSNLIGYWVNYSDESRLKFWWGILTRIENFWSLLTMEGREGPVSSSGGVTVVGSDAPSDYHVAPRLENPTQTPGSTAGPSLSALDPTAKKRRGRPRKYAPDGSVATPLSPKPISTAAPPAIDFSGPKRGKVKPTGYLIKPSSEDENLGKFARSYWLNFDGFEIFWCGI